MNLVNHFAGMQATAGVHDSGARFMGVNQQRMALANQASPEIGFAGTASLARQNKALELEGIRAQTNYLVYSAMQEAAAERRKKEAEKAQSSGSMAL